MTTNYGPYEVIPGIYQVRGFDLSDISFVRGKTGWIVFDPLVSAETARTEWELFQQHRGEGLPVSAVIYSHTHGDHWGRVRGIVNEADVRSGKVSVIAPYDLMQFTVSENVFAGNAMNRRLSLQSGTGEHELWSGSEDATLSKSPLILFVGPRNLGADLVRILLQIAGFCRAILLKTCRINRFCGTHNP